MCGCGLKPNLASTPARSIIRAKPVVVNGAPRSNVNTNGDLDPCSRWRRRRARNSRQGCVARVPCLTLRTCRVAISRSICSQRRSTSSIFLRTVQIKWTVNESFTLRRHYASEEIRRASRQGKASVLGFNFAQTAPVKWRIRRLLDAPLGPEGDSFLCLGCSLEGISHSVLRLARFLSPAGWHLHRLKRWRRRHTPPQPRPSCRRG